MQGTAFVELTVVAVMVFTATQARAQDAEDYVVRHDRKLEQMIMTAVAQRMGAIRGSLNDEWRPSSSISVLADMSARDVSLHAVSRSSSMGMPRQTTNTARQPRSASIVTITSSDGVRQVVADAPHDAAPI